MLPPGAQEEVAPSYESVYGAAGNMDRDHKEKFQDHYAYNGTRPENAECKPKNVILFGETGVGKSSVINLLAGDSVAKTSSGLEGCTLEAAEYSFTFPGPITLRIFDTVGLEEPEIGVNTFFGAITKAQVLVQSLLKAGGVDLLLFCIRGGRVTAAMQRNYTLFSDILCGGQVPLAIVVTSLEHEDVMEGWWARNQGAFQQYGIHSVAHACITALPAHIQGYAQKREESQMVLRNMFLEVMDNTKPSYVREQRSWLFAIIERLRSFLTKNLKFLKRREMLKKLEIECKFTRGDALSLVQMLGF